MVEYDKKSLLIKGYFDLELGILMDLKDYLKKQLQVRQAKSADT